MGAAISWADESHGTQRGDILASAGLADGVQINVVKSPEIDTVNISGGTFTTVGRDNITYNYNITQTVAASNGSQLREILEWISTLNFEALQQDIHEKWTPGTGGRLLRSQLFTQWLESICGTLWGTGMPGAGKTILASAIIAHVRDHFKDAGVYVAFAYCRYTEPVSVTEILAALVRQLLEQCPPLLQFVEPLYQRYSLQETKLTQKELLGLLRQFSRVIRITFIVDGLDEASYDTQFDLVEAIASLNARFLITSRPLDRLRSAIPDAVFFEVVAHAEDIGLLVAQRIQRDPRFAKFLEKHKLKNEVVTKVTQNSGGMFLHAALQIEMLRHSLTVKDLRDHMKKLPAKLDDMYAVTLARVNVQEPSHAELAKRILVWVIYAKRTLSVRELQYAVATCPETYQFEEDRLVDEETLLSVCCGLVTVEKESQGVRLVHYTAMDSLPSLLAAEFPHPHSLISEVCMARLVACGIHEFGPTMVDDLHKALAQHPLLRYAYTHWVGHVERCQDLHFITASALRLLSLCQAYPIDNSKLDGFRAGSGWDIEYLNPVQVACRYGLEFLLKHLLEQNPEFREPRALNSKTNAGQTALMLASWYGHDATARVLLDLEGIDVNAVDDCDTTALIQALRNGHEGTVKAILKSTTLDINMNDSATLQSTLSGGPALGLAHLLLDFPGIKIPEHIVLYAFGQPFWMMSQRIIEDFFGKNETGEQHSPGFIEQVLAESVCVSIPETCETYRRLGYHDSLAVMDCSSRGHDFYDPSGPEEFELNVLRLLDLLKPDEPLTRRGPFMHTALMAFAWAGIASAIPRVLKQPGVDVNATEDEGYTALAFAAKQGHDSVVRILVEVHGRDINTRNYRGWTPLMMASRRGHVDAVRTLLAQSDVEVDSVGVEQWTAVMIAANEGYGGVVKAFSEYPGSVDVNWRGEDGETALMLAASEGHEEVVKHLLEFDSIDVNATAKDGTTALMLAAYMGQEAVVRLLLAVPGVDIDAIGSHGVTALSAAQEAGHRKIVSLFTPH
ncbi:ankyrin repeat-containing domain protein [Coprinopsis sp. MPI-PUGE-AT-0042]|nr:ankyrin repeat-containing domain protein [Coprinopsis sp. MPI-PUGE-AT-0042]